MKVTVEDLQRYNACTSQIDFFRIVFGNEVEVTEKNAINPSKHMIRTAKIT